MKDVRSQTTKSAASKKSKIVPKKTNKVQKIRVQYKTLRVSDRKEKKEKLSYSSNASVRQLLEIQKECIICLLPITLNEIKLECGHDDFHDHCLDKWT